MLSQEFLGLCDLGNGRVRDHAPQGVPSDGPADARTWADTGN